MSRFYVTPESVKDKKIYVGREESHHIIDVMRLRRGDSVTVFDGTGREYRGTITSVENKAVVIDVSDIKVTPMNRVVSISLAQALPKKDKMDSIVQKATELGVEEILPFVSTRTVVKAGKDKRQQKIERWQKKIVEASKQCGRAELTGIREIARFDALLDRIAGYDLAIMPCLSGRAASLKSALKDANKPRRVLAIVGPEGGFTEDEITKAVERGAVLVSLGDFVLRSDTAAISIVSILNHEYI